MLQRGPNHFLANARWVRAGSYRPNSQKHALLQMLIIHILQSGLRRFYMIILDSFEQDLLCCHSPRKAEYILNPNGISGTTEQITKTDKAYATLESKRLVRQIARSKVVPFNGAIPKTPFILTEAGAEERERLINERSQ
jgi:hypothetical protein